MDVLDLIDKESILSPSQVLSILSINPELPLYIVAEYVSNTFKDLSDSIASIESDIKNAATKLETITFSSQAESEVKFECIQVRNTLNGLSVNRSIICGLNMHKRKLYERRGSDTTTMMMMTMTTLKIR